MKNRIIENYNTTTDETIVSLDVARIFLYRLELTDPISFFIEKRNEELKIESLRISEIVRIEMMISNEIRNIRERENGLLLVYLCLHNETLFYTGIEDVIVLGNYIDPVKEFPSLGPCRDKNCKDCYIK